jgi:Bacterial Ig-like domain (group 2)/Electron transfer DM13
MKKIIFVMMIIASITSCKKGEVVPEPVVVTVPEFLDIDPPTSSKLVGETQQFTLKYYNNTGVLSPTPSTGITWISSNTAVANVNTQGIAVAQAPGQAIIKATYNGITSTSAILTVVANANVLANVNITPNTTQEVILNNTLNMSATGTNLAGTTLSGLSFTWTSDASTLVSVSNAGLVTGLAYGSANIRATSGSIQSAPTMVQVIRQGNFTGMNSLGTAKLKIENNVLKLTTSTNFGFNTAPPDLRIYLTNSLTSVTNAVQIATLSASGITGGARTWNIPSTVNITQYRYAMIWCAQFTGNYGAADFGM